MSGQGASDEFFDLTSLAAKWLELLKEIAPSVTRVGVLCTAAMLLMLVSGVAGYRTVIASTVSGKRKRQKLEETRHLRASSFRLRDALWAFAATHKIQ
jgi:hypothetical protein